MLPAPRLVPDINVLLSGLTSRTGPARELFLAAQRFDVLFVLADEHFAELQRVLTYPQVLALGGGISAAEAFGLATHLYRVAQVVSPLQRHDWPSCPDPRDWYLLDLLMTSGADAIVSKDAHLLQVNRKLGVPVYEPKELVRLGII
ncbi:putative toxin-antitoxin system toxin component, PIN family [Deinococcus hopiensis]|uniref:Putative toxin-antitoxin system toxin component, PIN family n=1 Tax=Deinococcus hopiensis KR-140 TaxID=695939 RepID=A0A1W1UJT1_9DEIO|nr:putative toxin-antitoxin system toxin component, PIN family [Deinococcus hopiensis]SMB81273.1 putative toxin-antitoxin system toxin component, PIN family [Deinococcus hopiensis KR-140]